MAALDSGLADAVEQAAQNIAKAALVTNRASQGLPGTALQDIAAADRLTKQIEEIGKSVAHSVGASWTEQLGKTYATDIARASGIAGLAPSITKRLQESLGTAGLVQSRVSGVAGWTDAGVVNQRFAKQLSDMAGAGLVKQLTGVLPTTRVGVEHLKTIEGIAETKRIEAMLSKMTLPGFQDRVSGHLVGDVDQHPLRGPLAAKGFFPADKLASVFAGSSITGVTHAISEAAIGPLTKHIASLGAITVPNPFVEILERRLEIATAIEHAAKRWETSTLWFLLSIVGVGQLIALARMERTDVEAVLLDALESVVTAGTFTEALIATIEKAPSYVTADQRDDMVHGLEHARAGEFSRAAGPLTAGLEGALWSAGRELEVINSDRRLLDEPEKGKVRRVELVVRKLPAVQEFRKFVCGRVFGDLGNPLRHGEQSDRRQRSLFAIVAIAGWIDAFMKVPAADTLGTLLSDELASRAIPTRLTH